MSDESYINEQTIENALKNAYNCNEIKLHTCNIKLINREGESFCADIYRIKVKYTKIAQTQCEEQFILKVLTAEATENGSNELIMYAKILPELAKLQENIMAPDFKINPKCLTTEILANRELYLLEDLNISNFCAANRFIGLDESHARLCLKKLAIFHASGMLLMEQRSDLINQLETQHYVNGIQDDIGKVIYYGGTEFVAKLVSNWPGYEEISQKMLLQLPYYSELMKQTVLPENSKLKVLLHGDLWMNNMLFKYAKNGKPQDVIFIDFQNSFVGSVALDLNDLLYMCVQLEVLRTKFEELLNYYYNNLVQTLTAFEMQHKIIPKYETIIEEMQRFQFYAYSNIVCEMSMGCMDAETAQGFDAKTFLNAEVMCAKWQKLYANERVQSMLGYFLKQFNALGVLDLKANI